MGFTNFYATNTVCGRILERAALNKGFVRGFGDFCTKEKGRRLEDNGRMRRQENPVPTKSQKVQVSHQPYVTYGFPHPSLQKVGENCGKKTFKNKLQGMGKQVCFYSVSFERVSGQERKGKEIRRLKFHQSIASAKSKDPSRFPFLSNN